MYIGSIENAIQHYLGLGRDIPRVHCNTACSPPSVETSLLPALNQSATAQNLGSCLQHCSLLPVALSLWPLPWGSLQGDRGCQADTDMDVGWTKVESRWPNFCPAILWPPHPSSPGCPPPQSSAQNQLHKTRSPLPSLLPSRICHSRCCLCFMTPASRPQLTSF